MPPVRVNTLVIDTSVLPKRPETADIHKFMDRKLNLDMSLVRSIQLHNVKNVVFIGMKSGEEANRIAATHHLKHRMTCDQKEIEIQIPVYVESSAIDVRLHDLPDEIEDETITSYMARYGEVISIRSEVWRKFWPGCPNGVRVVKIKLTQSVPSYVSLTEDSSLLTLVTHRGQTKTCRSCSRPSHPTLRCSEVVSEQHTVAENNSRQQNSPSKAQDFQKNNKQRSSPPATASTPSPSPVPVTKIAYPQQQQNKINNKPSNVKKQPPIDSAKVNGQMKSRTTVGDEDDSSDSNSSSSAMITQCTDEELLDQVIKEVEEKNIFRGFTDPVEKRTVILEYSKSVLQNRMEEKGKRNIEK